MKKLLHETFGPLKETYPDLKIIGKDATFSLDSDRYANLSFTIHAKPGHSTLDHYNGVHVDVMSRSRGKLDSRTIAVEDVFDSMTDHTHPNRLNKHIWTYRGETAWYGKPTAGDIANLREAVNSYLDLMRPMAPRSMEPKKLSLQDRILAAEGAVPDQKIPDLISRQTMLDAVDSYVKGSNQKQIPVDELRSLVAKLPAAKQHTPEKEPEH